MAVCACPPLLMYLGSSASVIRRRSTPGVICQGGGQTVCGSFVRCRALEAGWALSFEQREGWLSQGQRCATELPILDSTTCSHVSAAACSSACSVGELWTAIPMTTASHEVTW